MITTLEKAIQIQHSRLSQNKRMFWAKAVLRYLLKHHKDDYQMMKQKVRKEARKLWLRDLESEDTEAA